MSTLENAAMPLIGPMAQGDDMFLSQAQQEIVATWIVKTCLVHVLVKPEASRAWFAHDYQDFYASQRPLDRHFIGVGVFSESGVHTLSHFQPIVAVVESKETPSIAEKNSYLATLAVGRFFGQVLMTPFPPSSIGMPGRHIVWPFRRDLIWPLAVAFDLPRLQQIARTGFPTIDPHPRSATLRWTDVI
jgi:hypothetical protein